jgi:hypothetical protein
VLGLGLILAGWAGGAKPAAVELPDLLIRAAEAAPLSATKLRVEVFNRGRVASGATRLTLFYQRAGEVKRTLASVPALEPGEAIWTTVDAGAALSDAARLTLRVDDPSVVVESDELNNGYSVK